MNAQRKRIHFLVGPDNDVDFIWMAGVDGRAYTVRVLMFTPSRRLLTMNSLHRSVISRMNA